MVMVVMYVTTIADLEKQVAAFNSDANRMDTPSASRVSFSSQSVYATPPVDDQKTRQSYSEGGIDMLAAANNDLPSHRRLRSSKSRASKLSTSV